MSRGKKAYPTPYGEGSVYFHNGRNRWEGYVIVGKDENGKAHSKYVHGKNPTDVRKRLEKIRFEIAAGNLPVPSEITLRTVIEDELKDRLNLNKISPSTYDRDLKTLDTMEPLIDARIQRLNYFMVKQYLMQQTNKSDSAIKKIYRLLCIGFDAALDRKIIAANPMISIRKPRSKKPPQKVRALTVEEQRKLLDALKKESHRIYVPQMYIAMFTGMRMGEINALTVNDVNLKYGFINIDKTVIGTNAANTHIKYGAKTEAGNRQIPISSVVRSVFEEVLANKELNPDEPVFRNSEGSIVATKMVNHSFKRILDKYHILNPDIPGIVSQHSLRHTYATRCIEGGMDSKVLQSLMGHANIETTLDVYSDVFEQFEKNNISKVDAYISALGIDLHTDD